MGNAGVDAGVDFRLGIAPFDPSDEEAVFGTEEPLFCTGMLLHGVIGVSL